MLTGGQQMNSLLFLALVSLRLSAMQVDARPAAATRRADQPPQLDDTLAVAKSPLEPVTMALNLPARTDQLPLETTPKLFESDLSASPSEQDEQETSKRTTRSAQSFEEQQSSSSTKGLEENAGLSGSTKSVATEALEESSSTEAATETATKANENDPVTTTTTTQSPVVRVTAVDSASTVAEPAAGSTTEEPATTTTTKQPDTTEPPATTTEQPTTTVSATLAPTTAEVGSTSEDSSSSSDLSSTNLKEDGPKETELTTTPTTPTTPTQTTSITPTSPSVATSEPPSETPQPTTTTSAPKDVPTTSAAAEREPAASSTELPTTSTTRSPDTQAPSSPAPTPNATVVIPTEEPEKKEEEAKPACNHLPTYDSEEIQKVFREETTFKNGTIKGKFTYINFDQRYRLVHYTRMPYGPVKIDRVEELGRPNQSSSTPTVSEVPNAVLQLRNLLPNSLFGFPFLGPQNSQSGQPTQFNGPNGRDADDDRSNMYFYSTDSLATPNLLTPRVPVSVLPGQRLKASALGQPLHGSNSGGGPASQPEALEHSYLGYASNAAKPAAFGMPNNPQGDYSKQLNKLDVPRPLQVAAPRANSQPSIGTQNQFQYATYPLGQPVVSDPAVNKGLVYSYFSPSAPAAAHRYQFAPLTPPSRAFSMHHHLADPTPFASADQLQQTAASPFFWPHHHQAHQPHSHEHFIAPFMLSPPAEPLRQLDSSGNDNSRVRLKVKTSKALNVNQEGTKSAQLRMRPSDGLSSGVQVESPVKHHQRNQQQRQQQRLGKQNHQLKPSSLPANRSPVVYHVLRNPYNQFNQGYAVAYDNDS